MNFSFRKVVMTATFIGLMAGVPAIAQLGIPPPPPRPQVPQEKPAPIVRNPTKPVAPDAPAIPPPPDGPEAPVDSEAPVVPDGAPAAPEKPWHEPEPGGEIETFLDLTPVSPVKAGPAHLGDDAIIDPEAEELPHKVVDDPFGEKTAGKEAVYFGDATGKPADPSKIITVNNDYFTIITDDGDSGIYVRQISQLLGENLSRHFRLLEIRGANVYVRLVPGSRWNLDVPFKTAIEIDRQVTVAIRWDAETDKDTLFRALAQSLMVREIYLRHGQKAAARFPLWLELGIVEELKIRLNPVHRDRLIIQGQKLGMLSAEAIITARRPEDATRQLAVNAFWFMEFLQRESASPANHEALFAGLLKALTPETHIVNSLPIRFRGRDEYNLWWAIGWQNLTTQNPSPVLSPDSSRDLLMEFAAFVLSEEGQDVAVPLESLWDARKNDDVQSALDFKLRALKINIAHFNPLYYNAALSLGQAMEELQKRWPRRRNFERALETYFADLTIADSLAFEADKIFLREEMETAQILKFQ